ncbi:MAG: hypothetical protein NC225_10270 [Clostridium sp.]|nr:hypothetical protein [Clostridium sp.]MCM1399849.1 hypothetical protein [Clostridium sp.]MCM1460666.1 hypothetical protein [Bacteroides sp.]
MNINLIETIIGVLFGITLSVTAIVGGIQTLVKLKKSKKADFMGGAVNSEEEPKKTAFSVILTIIYWGIFIYGIYIIAGNINYSFNSEFYSEKLEELTDNIMYYTHFCFFGVSAIIMIITGIYRQLKMVKQQALIPEAQLQTYLNEKKNNQIMLACGAVILLVTIVILVYNNCNKHFY